MLWSQFVIVLAVCVACELFFRFAGWLIQKVDVQAGDEFATEPATIQDAIIAIGEGFDYLLDILEHHGLDVESVDKDIELAITQLFQKSLKGGYDMSILVQVKQAVESVVKLLQVDIESPTSVVVSGTKISAGVNSVSDTLVPITSSSTDLSEKSSEEILQVSQSTGSSAPTTSANSAKGSIG